MVQLKGVQLLAWTAMTVLSAGFAPEIWAAARDYPDKPIRFLVGLAPGGGVDFTARMISAKLSAALGQQVIVDNRAGAGGSIAASLAAKSAPDGYTMLMGSRSNIVVNALITKDLGYDPLRDLAPITLATSQSMVLVVNPSVPANTVQELMTLAKSQPGKLSFGSGGIGTGTHLAGALFSNMAKVSMVHVPYKGGAQSMVDLVAGQIQLIFQSLPTAMSLIKAGKIRALAVTTIKRSAILPGLPTIAESGVLGYDANNWYGIAVAARTPHLIVHRLNAEIVRVLSVPDVKQALFNQGLEVAAGTPEAFRAYIKSEHDKWKEVVKDAGIRAE